MSSSSSPRFARWLTSPLAVFALAVAFNAPTAGDLGLTWDEPAYRYSQLLSVQWWERLAQSRSVEDVAPLLDKDALLYYWPYGRFGINFHPPLAGQLNLGSWAIFHGIMKDIPARRMASVLEFSLVIAVLYGFLRHRYGVGVGLTAAGALLLMPRVYGDAHVIGTDMPGLMLWVLTAIAFRKGLETAPRSGVKPKTRRWRMAVGVLLGLCFVEKMAAVMVLLPIFGWLAARGIRFLFTTSEHLKRFAIVDAILTTIAIGTPSAIVLAEILRLQDKMPAPQYTNFFRDLPESSLPGWVLAIPAVMWFGRRMMAWVFRRSLIWGVERPGLETLHAIMAFAPLVGWLGNPAWWAETLPRLAHYYTINSARRGLLPNILILYFGRTYDFSLPWHNAFVWIAVTVPASVLIAAIVGMAWKLNPQALKRDRLPLYFLVHLLALPAVRMTETPAHDGVRLFLPTFFFLAAFAGWGAMGLADLIAKAWPNRALIAKWGMGLLILAPSGYQLAKVHPYELSYYNEFAGGPRGAWDSDRGFELAYWFDAFNGPFLDQINRELPKGARVSFPNRLSEPPTFLELIWLGELRPDIDLAVPPHVLSYKWLLTQDAKADAFSRLLFAMRPFLESRPKQLDGLRVATVADPVAVSRALALQYLCDEPRPPTVTTSGDAPLWVSRYVPKLGRFWGDGLTVVPPLQVNEDIFAWAKDDPDGLRAASRTLIQASAQDFATTDPQAQRLLKILDRYPSNEANPIARQLIRERPEALAEAVEILIRYPQEVRTVLTRPAYTNVARIGGYLDRDLTKS